MIKFKAPFKMVEIEINAHCNRRCSYCPQGVASYRKSPRFMDIENFKRITLILKEADFEGRLSYHFYNEPLLHRQLDDFIKIVRDELPKAHQVIFTNGDLLTDKRYLELRELGVYKLIVTSHGGKVFPEREGQVNLTPQNLNLTNRGGKVLEESETLHVPCFAPSTMLIVGIDGDILICYEDADKKTVLGNLFLTPLSEIWNSEKAVRIRARLEAGDRTVEDICKVCNNVSHNTPIIYDVNP